MPEHFKGVMHCLLFSEFTNRDGKLNLIHRLPDIYVRPDMGPKMLIAYGSTLHPSTGTTNLHLDVSDALNLLVHATKSNSGEGEVSKRTPAALWHIYKQKEVKTIRKFLNKMAADQNHQNAYIDPDGDPIHDGNIYLSEEIRERLKKECNMVGYEIEQCQGDIIFIPAGSPHQVKNLLNCIKIAEDFVSPENLAECFQMTNEFRALSDRHLLHQDKLQIKNITFHSIKDAVSVLNSSHHQGSNKANKEATQGNQIMVSIKLSALSESQLARTNKEMFLKTFSLCSQGLKNNLKRCLTEKKSTFKMQSGRPKRIQTGKPNPYII